VETLLTIIVNEHKPKHKRLRKQARQGAVIRENVRRPRSLVQTPVFRILLSVFLVLSIAASAAGASLANAAMVRDTVGSEATHPYTTGCSRSTAMSARQSPPRLSVTARSVSTFAGSCIAKGLRHDASALDNPTPKPLTPMVSVSNIPPPDDTVEPSDLPTATRG